MLYNWLGYLPVDIDPGRCRHATEGSFESGLHDSCLAGLLRTSLRCRIMAPSLSLLVARSGCRASGLRFRIKGLGLQG